jgi:hypothetical protein
MSPLYFLTSEENVAPDPSKGKAFGARRNDEYVGSEVHPAATLAARLLDLGASRSTDDFSLIIRETSNLVRPVDAAMRAIVTFFFEPLSISRAAFTYATRVIFTRRLKPTPDFKSSWARAARI